MPSTYLTRTVSSASNRRTWTWSGWIKRGALSGNQALFTSRSDNSNYATIRLEPDRFHIFDFVSSNFNYQVKTNRRLRDVNGWYHLVVAFDTTQATASNRVKLYVNGVQETSLAESSYPAQNYEGFINRNRDHYIGQGGNQGDRFDGSMSHINFVDGTALTPSSFGETDSTTGEWKIKTSPSVTYGTEGFFILKDGNSVTDQSGNSNNWTVGGGTLTKTEDCPSNVFATINPLYNVTTFNGSKLSNGNTTASCSTNYKGVILSTLGASTGKYYFEAKITNADDFGVGITDDAISLNTWSPSSGNYVFYLTDGSIRRPSGSTASGTTYTTNDIIGVAWNATDSEVTFYKNGSAIASAYSVEGTQGTMMFAVADVGTSSDNTVHCNFGNGYFGTTAVSSAGTNASGIGIFEYDVPTGYTALSTKGLNE